MKKIILLISIALAVNACSSKKEGNMIVQGTIKGLKKGTLFLQKVKDSMIISVDSISLLDKNTFILSDNVGSPEMYYLLFDGNNTNKRILFFGEKGTIIINDDVTLFGYNPKISGSKNQDILSEFLKVNKKFSNQNLEFIKKEFEIKKDNNKDSIALLNKNYSRFIRRKYLYTTNFALTNKDFEVAPYLALTQLSDANTTLLDTINNSLSEKVKNSKYGKQLNTFISKRKAEILK